jgi:hypothetical protein
LFYFEAVSGSTTAVSPAFSDFLQQFSVLHFKIAAMQAE